ncbi:hypothetical protein [Lysinibacillus piscis]|uniref:Uncharacterized protein n=1 Tax=Lysinibacillus piscis TaxID=2518931 RepID=A0ABQ5NPT9_9BACI|nr:hypothetical protein [Lysinibacillus sp. KH24]GLC90344.1 hypothetical protein LYSBPC_34710 [Lysinibacillus sp. KH24]
MVTVQQFEQKLLEEVEFLKQGATTYRQQTAELSLKVLESVHDVTLFFNRIDVMKAVSKVLKTADADRQRDVAKMLNVLYVQMHSEQNRTAELEKQLAERRRKRKKISLILTK